MILDILINYADGPVQRGLGGTVSIWLYSILGGSPAFWAWGLGFLAGTVFTALVISLYRRLPDNVVFLPFILAPSGLLFFAYDSQAPFRKETFGYVAIALILVAIFAQTERRFKGLTLAGALTYITALFLHEGNIFLWPAFGLALALAGFSGTKFNPKTWLITLAGVTLLGGVSIFWALELQPMPDIEIMCKAAKVTNCTGAFYFLSQDANAGIQYVLEIRGLWDIAISLMFFILGILPFAFLRLTILPQKWLWYAITILALAVIPLFIFASDWGRWVHMAVMPLNMLAVTALALGFARFRLRLPAWLSLAYILLWCLPPVNPIFKLLALNLAVLLALLLGLNWLWRHQKIWRPKPG